MICVYLVSTILNMLDHVIALDSIKRSTSKIRDDNGYRCLLAVGEMGQGRSLPPGAAGAF